MTTKGTQGVGQRRPNPAVIAEGTARAYELKLAGHTVRGIADILTAELKRPVGKSTVARWITDACKERVEPLADEYRAILVDRLERAVRRCEEIIERESSKDDPNPIVILQTEDRLLRNGERLARLKGLDSPVQVTGDLTVNYRLVTDGQVGVEALT